MRVVVVNNVKVAESAPRHPLHHPLPEVVERYGDLHLLVDVVSVASSEKHGLHSNEANLLGFQVYYYYYYFILFFKLRLE